MDKHKILVDAKAELERHAWGTFVEGKATVALGGTGVIVSGCEACLMSCQVFCKGLSRLPAPRLRNSRDTLRPEFMFGLVPSSARMTSCDPAFAHDVAHCLLMGLLRPLVNAHAESKT
jgi:hypothetical protein